MFSDLSHSTQYSAKYDAVVTKEQPFCSINFAYFCIIIHYASAFLLSDAFCMTCTSIYTKSTIVMAVKIAVITTTDIATLPYKLHDAV